MVLGGALRCREAKEVQGGAGRCREVQDGAGRCREVQGGAASRTILPTAPGFKVGMYGFVSKSFIP